MFGEPAHLYTDYSPKIPLEIQTKNINLFKKITNLFPLSIEGRVDYFDFLMDEIYIFLIRRDCYLGNYFRWSLLYYLSIHTIDTLVPIGPYATPPSYVFTAMYNFAFHIILSHNTLYSQYKHLPTAR